MPSDKKSISADILIVGAGPAGAACSLALSESGLKVILTDEKKFPRDKICGDAIPHRAVRIISKLAPELYQRLNSEPLLLRSAGCRVVAPNRKYIDVHFSLEGFLSRRVDFDQLLLGEVLKTQSAKVYQGEKVRHLELNHEGIIAETDSFIFSVKLIIGCDGAHSVVKKYFSGNEMDPKHYCGAVRAYYRNVKNISANRMEIHLLKKLPFAYFWIFPLPGGWVNAGLGMLSEKISEHKISLRKEMEKLLAEDSHLAARFRDAQAEGVITGYGLPLGSQKVNISGERFMLCGDAASLIDPATGEGIGNAMFSGMMAGRHAIGCFRENNFSAAYMRNYDVAVFQNIGSELRNKYVLQQLLGQRPWLASWAVAMAGRSAWMRKKMQKLF